MKGAQLLRQLRATTMTSSGLMNRLRSGNGLTAVFNDGALRGMATTADRKSITTTGPVDKTPTLNVGSAKPGQSPRSTKTQQVWWRPDPVTGHWVPESSDLATSFEAPQSSERIVRVRAESTDATEDKVWWTSMEEIPDMDRPKDL